MIIVVVLKRTNCRVKKNPSLLGAGVLGHGLGSLGDSVLGQLSRKEKPDSSLDLTGCDGRPLVVMSQS